jgi:hypothetical protein
VGLQNPHTQRRPFGGTQGKRVGTREEAEILGGAYSNWIRTISGVVHTRRGGPQVPAPLEV